MQYPATTLGFQKGKYYVVVIIPDELREHFNSRKQLKRSTGTSDKQLAQQIQHEKSIELYLQFDQAIQTKKTNYTAMKSYIDKIGFNGEEYLEGQDLSNPYVADHALQNPPTRAAYPSPVPDRFRVRVQ